MKSKMKNYAIDNNFLNVNFLENVYSTPLPLPSSRIVVEPMSVTNCVPIPILVTRNLDQALHAIPLYIFSK